MYMCTYIYIYYILLLYIIPIDIDKNQVTCLQTQLANHGASPCGSSSEPRCQGDQEQVRRAAGRRGGSAADRGELPATPGSRFSGSEGGDWNGWWVVWKNFYVWLVGNGCHLDDSPLKILGMSSSQLTNSYFSEGWPSHQPDIYFFHNILGIIISSDWIGMNCSLVPKEWGLLGWLFMVMTDHSPITKNQQAWGFSWIFNDFHLFSRISQNCLIHPLVSHGISAEETVVWVRWSHQRQFGWACNPFSAWACAN